MNKYTDPQYLALLRENEQLREYIQTLEHNLNRDSFTQIYNRKYFMENLELKCRDSKQDFGLLFVDVDGLKMINDQFGHAAGDEILLQVAHMLCAAVGPNDLVARMGGDEFAILLDKVVSQNQEMLIKDMSDKIYNIDFQIGSSQLCVAVSTGMAIGKQGSVPTDILAQADSYMYRDKKLKAAGNDNMRSSIREVIAI